MAFAATVVVSCGAQPKHVNIRMAQASQLFITGGPVGSSVMVDGIEIWRLVGQNRDRIDIADGEHNVRIVFNNTELYRRVIFIQNGTKKVIELR